MIDSLADLVEVEATVLRELRPTDVLVLRHPGRLPDNERALMGKQLSKVFPKQTVLLLEDGMQLEVMRKGDDE